MQKPTIVERSSQSPWELEKEAEVECRDLSHASIQLRRRPGGVEAATRIGQGFLTSALALIMLTAFEQLPFAPRNTNCPTSTATLSYRGSRISLHFCQLLILGTEIMDPIPGMFGHVCPSSFAIPFEVQCAVAAYTNNGWQGGGLASFFPSG